MKKRLYFIILCAVVIFVFLPSHAYGDVGPKPSVVVKFEGFEGETYYVTLLSEVSSTGPHSTVDNYQRFNEEDKDYEIWKKFASYKDEDGYYFLQYFNDCTETSQFMWGYYPPQLFKILVYFPEIDSFAVSEIYDRYAFDSYYKVNARNLELIPNSTFEISAQKNYNYTWEVLSLAARIIITIAIEILVAMIFGYRKKNQLNIILITNILTQTILNVILNVVNYFLGSMVFVASYILAEIIVIIIEASVYTSLLAKYGEGRLSKKVYAVLYAVIANIVSFVAGLYIAKLLPGIF